ncbi:MAG TPA: hypothetical protein VGJ73_02800 [Verrucomicrobiae bacterium]|jgi:hypothetical protein
MSLKGKLVHELKMLGLITLYFAAWVGMILLLKKLLLAQYGIHFSGLALALIGTVLLAKVVLLMEHIPVGAWIRNQPAVVPVILRTFIYALGVLLALTIEKAFEERHQYGSFARALTQVCQHPEYPRVLFNTICVGLALLGFNILSVLRQHFGKKGLSRLFFARPEGQQEEAARTEA